MLRHKSHRGVMAAKFSRAFSTAARARCYLQRDPMAEATPTEKASATKPPTKKPPATKKRASGAPPPRSAGEGVADWRTWAAVGGVLVVGVVAWKLLGSSYKGDVETICNGENASGFTVEHDMSKVTAYVRQHLDTPEGNELFSALSDAKLAEKAKHLQSESTKAGLRSCPMVEAYEKLSAEGEYRFDVQHLCSNTAFPHLAEVDDAARLQRLEDWIDQGAKSPRTKELAEQLRQGTPADRAKLLRETAAKIDVYSCDLAKTLEGPVLPAKGTGLPMVRPYAEPQIIGTLKPEDLAKALIQVTPAMNDCYKAGLAKKADLEGKLAVKVKIDPTGKVIGIAPADAAVPDKDTTACILLAMRGMQFPKNPGPLVSVFIPLELTTTALPTAGAGVGAGAGMGGTAGAAGMPGGAGMPGMAGAAGTAGMPGAMGMPASSGVPMPMMLPPGLARPQGSAGH